MIEKKYYTVNDLETVKLLLKHIEESEEIAYDTETNSLNVRKGSIIGFSISGDIGIGFYMPTMVFNTANNELEEVTLLGRGAHETAKKILSELKGKRIICHNASFDLRFTKNFYGIDLVEDLYVDTAMLVHTVQEEGAFGIGGSPFGLKTIAKKWQVELKLDESTQANQEQLDLKESIVRNGGSVTKDNYEIYKADLEILSKYAAADTDLTLRICRLFLEKLKEENLEKFFFQEEVMPIYKEVTIPMEEFGVRLDLDLIKQIKDEITVDMEIYKTSAMQELIRIKEVQTWVKAKAKESYPPNNKGTFAQKLLELSEIEMPRSAKGKFSINKASVKLLEPGPIKDFLVSGDATLLDDQLIEKVTVKLWREDNDGEVFNIQSKDQLGKIVFDALGLKPLSTTTKGKAQFDDDFIDTIADKHPWAKNLQIYNRLTKIKSAYVDRFWDRQEDGRYYFYFKQNGTVSGRYGSDLQQLPKPKEEGEAEPIVMKYTNVVRAFLIAEEGRTLIDCDYESLEPHCFASVSGDKSLQEIFNKNWDFYSTVAIKTEKLDEDKVNYPNGVSADKKSPVFLKKLNPLKRQTAKSYALGIAYGMSGYALAMTLGCSQKEANDLVEGYLNGFPGLKNWRETSRAFVKKHGYIENKVGRVRHLPQVSDLYNLQLDGNKKLEDGILDWKVRRELEGVYGKEGVDFLYKGYRNGLNNCLNFQLQSLAAAVVNRAAVEINRELKQMGIDGRVQAQVHDQLVINVPDEYAEEVAKMVKDKMENTTKLEGVTLKAPPCLAKNFRDGH